MIVQNYFTISEFAKLRNININSLRYYEKLGVFKPDKIDEVNGYRYYSVNQLSELDFILLCIDLGIPIKELKKFRSNDGCLHTRNLMEYGRKHLLNKMKECQQKLDRLDRALEYMDANRPFNLADGFYKKHVAKRIILTELVPMDFPGSITMEKALAKIYRKAADAELFPLFPIGLLINMHDGQLDTYIFTSVVGDSSGVADISFLPDGDYLCTQVNVRRDMNLLDEVKKSLGNIDNVQIVVEHIFYEDNTDELSRSEIQKLID